GIFFGYKLFKKGQSLRREPQIREKLNKLMQEALNHFSNSQYNSFFEIMAIPYAQYSSYELMLMLEFIKLKQLGSLYKNEYELFFEKLATFYAIKANNGNLPSDNFNKKEEENNIKKLSTLHASTGIKHKAPLDKFSKKEFKSFFKKLAIPYASTT